MSEDSSQPPSVRCQGARFSLASILLLTVVVAVYLGAIRPGFVGEQTRSVGMTLGALCGLAIGSAVGFVIGQGQSPRRGGRATGLVTGAVAGLGAGTLLALPDSLWVIIPGAMLLVLFAALVRWLSRGRLE